MQVIEHLARFSKITFLLIIFLIQFSDCLAQAYPDKSVDSILKSGINLIIDQKYDEARSLFEELDKNRKDIPFGKIYLAAVSIAKSYDYNLPFDDEAILNNLDEAKNLSETLLESDDKNIWNIYFFALSEGYIAYYKALRENWIDALSSGLNSVSAFEHCLDLDKNFSESLIAIGSYKFWKSKKTEFISWLPFIHDEKEIGIRYLKDAVKNTSYNSHIAIYSLIWIYIEQEEYSDAIIVAENALAKHPESRLFKWGLARSYENVDPVKSIKIYKDILDSYPKFLNSNRINEVTLKHIIAQQFLRINKSQDALEICNEILSIADYTEYEFNKLSTRLDRVRALKDKLTAK